MMGQMGMMRGMGSGMMGGGMMRGQEKTIFPLMAKGYFIQGSIQKARL